VDLIKLKLASLSSILAIVKKLLEVNLAPLPDSPENDRREFHKMQPKVAELMLPLKPRQGTKNWDFRSVASEVVIKWSLDYQKSLFNALLLIGGLLEHITARLIDTISITKIEDLEVDHFERVFDAFAVQTQAQFGKAQEAIVTKTTICSSLRKFLDLLDPKVHFKQGSFADRVMMHITSMCTYYPKSKEDESTKTLTVVTNKLCQADFVPYCLKMLKEYADQMNSRDENKHTRKIGIAILLNLVAFSPLARTKVNQEQNMTLICDVLKEEKKDLFDLHDGNVSDLDTTRVVDTLDDNEKKIMTEDEQRTYGNIVSKSARHIGHVMTIGYAALILAHLIKANEFVVKKIKAQLDSDCFKLSLDCFDEMENILSATGKEDDKSKRLIQEARDIFSKHGYH